MKAIIVQAINQNEKTYDDLCLELTALCKACDIEVSNIVTQRIEKVNIATYIGKGKAFEIKQMINDEDMVIFEGELTPLQVKKLTDIIGKEVTDRTDLILRIFYQRAQTKEAKLQVEIARDQYLLPRLAGMQEHMSHQQGGSGFRGSGEKQIELDRRILQRRMTKARRELATIVKQRQTQRRKRKNTNIHVIALVGYTNSGKSTIMNHYASDKQVFQKDMLFATLQTATRAIKIHNHPVLLTDTVGFIDQLPHTLVQAFRSTLEEIKEADLLLHVVDTSMNDYQRRIDTTNHVLNELGAKGIPMIYVYNKVDLNRYGHIDPLEPYVFVSAKDNIGFDLLEKKMVQALFKDYAIYEFNIPYENHDVFNYLHQHTLVLELQYLQDHIYMKVETLYQDIKPYEVYLMKH